jgi:hypothetical protein
MRRKLLGGPDQRLIYLLVVDEEQDNVHEGSLGPRYLERE